MNYMGPGAARRSEYLKKTKTKKNWVQSTPSHYGNRHLRLANGLMAVVNADEVAEYVRDRGLIFHHPVQPFVSFRRLFT